jgi:RHS repeat-associated protein
MRIHRSRVAGFFFFVAIAVSCAFGQGYDPSYQYGAVPFQTHLQGQESVNLSNGNLHFQIPLISLPGRNGHDFVYSLSYNSQVWWGNTTVTPNGPQNYWVQNNNWSSGFPIMTLATVPTPGFSDGSNCTNYSVTLAGGRKLYFPVYTNCVKPPNNTGDPLHNQSSGSSMDPTAPLGGGCITDFAYMSLTPTPHVVLEDGHTIWFTAVGVLQKEEDANGNSVTYTFPGDGTAVAADTVGRQISFSKPPPLSNVQTITYKDSTGTTQTVTIASTSVPFSPHFHWSNAPDPTPGNAMVPTSITYPNGDRYDFQYNNYLELTKIIYPSGGYTRYDYNYFNANPVGLDVREVVGKHVCRDYNSRAHLDGNGQPGSCVSVPEDNTVIAPTVLTSNPPANSATQVTSPSNDVSTYAFTVTSKGAYETERKLYSGASTLLRTIDTAYGACGVGPSQQKVTLDDGSVSMTQWDRLDQYTVYAYQSTSSAGTTANVTAKREYDSAAGQPGALLRQTATTWMHVNPVNGIDYTSPAIHILNRKASDVVSDGANNVVAQTTYEYDNFSTAMQASGAVQHDSAYLVSASPLISTRGNLTATKRWLNTNNSWLTTANTYDDAGNALSTTDPKGNITGFSYADSWNNRTCLPTGGSAAAYVTKITNALSQFSTQKFNSCSGTVASSTDLNGKATTFSYDAMSRVTLTQYPDGGQVAKCYSDGGTGCTSTNPQLSETTTTAVTASSLNIVTQSLADGLGQVVQTQLQTDPDGLTYTDTAYDGLGRVSTRSNPHRAASSSTDGTTTSVYDGLNRTTSVIQPDNSTVSTSYSGNSVTVTDEAGNQRRSISDGLGRLVEVDEPTIVQTVAGSGSATTAGSEQSVTTSGSPGTGTVSISGTLNCSAQDHGNHIPDNGIITITVNGVPVSTNYGGGCDGAGNPINASTPTTLASALASALTSSSANVNATSSVGLITITAKTSGASTNYSLSATSVTTQTQYYSGTSFPVSVPNPNLTGGTNGTTTYDTGSAWVTVNGFQAPVNYDQNSTSSSVASAIANYFNTYGSSPVGASVSGSQITLVAKQGGSQSDYPLSAGSSTSQPGTFSQPSFTISVSGPNLTGGAGGGLSSPYVTLYTYDTLNNLKQVTQKGDQPSDSSQWRTRTFTYDSLSRLLSASNPESGAIAYTYDNDSNLATKLDARGITATMSYDALNRLTQKSYNDGQTATVQYGYDGTALSGCTTVPPTQTDSNPKGRRTAMCDASGATSWSHDSMGRTLIEKRTMLGFSAITNTVKYTYNLDGSVATLTYPKSGKVITYTPGGAGRMLAAQDTASGINYVQNAHYAPFGGLTSMTHDATPITTTNTYNSRLQPSTLSAATGTATILSLSYNFHLGAGDNGNVFQIVNNRDGNRTQNFAYDGLNRIQQASSAGPNWGEAFTIDAWGNLTGRGPVAGKSNYEFLSQAALTNNQLTGFGYDASGNMTSNGGASYAYDAENRLFATSGVIYTYDGDGKRVKKSSSTLYWTGTGSETLSETNLSGTTQAEYIYFNGKRVARRDVPGTPTVKYYFSDHLGSASVITNNTGTMPPLEESDYYPYGGEIAVSGSDSNHYKFTGKERDAESGLDNFGARYNASTLGRFMTPDWAARPTNVPYAVFGDPQSLNLYTYVRNDPVARADADGHTDQCTDDTGYSGSANVRCAAPARAQNQGGFWQKLGNVLNDKGWKTNEQVAATEAKSRADWTKAYPGMPYPDVKVGAVTPFSGVGAAARAGELASAMGKTANFVTIAVTETEEGVNVVSSSENALRPAVKAMLGEGEVGAQGAGHAEVTGVNAAQQMGLTPTGVAASRGICPSCAQFLEDLGIEALSVLK